MCNFLFFFIAGLIIFIFLLFVINDLTGLRSQCRVRSSCALYFWMGLALFFLFSNLFLGQNAAFHFSFAFELMVLFYVYLYQYNQLRADGQVHKSLGAPEILYLTLACLKEFTIHNFYSLSDDWMLFGHNFSDRITKGEDVLYFCFDFLQYILEGMISVA